MSQNSLFSSEELIGESDILEELNEEVLEKIKEFTLNLTSRGSHSSTSTRPENWQCLSEEDVQKEVYKRLSNLEIQCTQWLGDVRILRSILCSIFLLMHYMLVDA
jgi:hypothetical protein